MQIGSFKITRLALEVTVLAGAVVLFGATYFLTQSNTAATAVVSAQAVTPLSSRDSANLVRSRSCFVTSEHLEELQTKMGLYTFEETIGCKGTVLQDTRIDYVSWKTIAWRGRQEGTGIVVLFKGSQSQSITNLGL